MDQIKELEERLREAACIGDMESLKNLIEFQKVDVNSVNHMNGWSALHWAVKRNHPSVVKYLLDCGADKSITTQDGHVAENLTQNQDIRTLLGASGDAAPQQSLPITPSYLQHPSFPHGKSKNDIGYSGGSTTPVSVNHGTSYSHNSVHASDELVLKVRLANSDDRDFIEVELDKKTLTFEALVTLLCTELNVERRLVHKIRKLPDTVVRKDKDVRRLVDFQALEMVLTNKALSAASRTYSGYASSPAAMRSEQILY